MIQPSKKLKEIVKKSFEEGVNTGKWDTELRRKWADRYGKWHDHLSSLGVHVQVTNSGDGSDYLIDDIMSLLDEGCSETEESGCDYVACSDPMNYCQNNFFRILFFPKELAEKVLVLGCLPE